VVGIGTPEEMKKFVFRIKFWGLGSRDTTTFEGSVISIDVLTGEVIDTKVGSVMSDEFVRRIWDGNLLNYELDIFEEN
jgi:hypothetical protein